MFGLTSVFYCKLVIAKCKMNIRDDLDDLPCSHAGAWERGKSVFFVQFAIYILQLTICNQLLLKNLPAADRVGQYLLISKF
jgi:hypothetical protein